MSKIGKSTMNYINLANSKIVLANNFLNQSSTLLTWVDRHASIGDTQATSQLNFRIMWISCIYLAMIMHNDNII